MAGRDTRNGMEMCKTLNQEGMTTGGERKKEEERKTEENMDRRTPNIYKHGNLDYS